MSKTIIVAAALASILGLSASLPAHAAARSVGITVDRFADRCIEQGGTMSDANPSFVCQTPKTVIDCTFLDLNTAQCEWAGIDNQIAVNRVIGMADAVTFNDGSGTPVPGAPIKKPNFPIKWK